MNTRIISFANHKGGVGKTTTTASVGSILAKKGYKVLVIDMDAQANLTVSLMKQPSEDSIYDALTGRGAFPVVPISDHLFLSPASEKLALADMELAGAISREQILSGLLEESAIGYDLILIDCPPSLGVLTLNAITASTDVVVPLVAEVLPFNGLKMISNFVITINARLNKSVHITGVLITRWESTNLSKSIEQSMRDRLGDIVFQTKIRKNVSVAEAPFEAKNIVEYAPKSNGAIDYKSFTEELLAKLNIKQEDLL